MKNIHHHRLMYVNQRMFSSEVDHIMYSIFIDFHDIILLLKSDLFSSEFMNTQRSFRFQIFALIRRYLTYDALSFIFDIDYENLLFMIAYKINYD